MPPPQQHHPPLYPSLAARYPVFQHITTSNNDINTQHLALHASHRGGLYRQPTHSSSASSSSSSSSSSQSDNISDDAQPINIENSAESYYHAIAHCHTHILEVDPWLTADGVVVLNHDGVYGGKNVADHSYDRLTSKDGDEDKLMTLERLLQLIPQWEAERNNNSQSSTHTTTTTLFLDLKHIPAIPQVVKLINQHNWQHRVMYGAVDQKINKAAQIALAALPTTTPLCADVQTMKEFTAAYDKDHRLSDFDWTVQLGKHTAVGWFVEPHSGVTKLLTQSLIDLVHSHHKMVFLVGTALDDPATQRHYISMGVDVLFVDRPWVLRQTLDELQQARKSELSVSDPTTANHMHASNSTHATSASSANGNPTSEPRHTPRKAAETRLQAFIDTYVTGSGQPLVDLTNAVIDDIKFSEDSDSTEFNPTLSLFNSKDDTMLYGKLLAAALERDAHQDQPLVLIDLGCGSCIPSLMALTRTKRRNVHVIGVDVDQSALDVSRQNAQKYGFDEQYTLVLKPMAEFLDGFKFESAKRYLVCTNPPYIATPDLSLAQTDDARHWLPVDGGKRGDKFLRAVYDREYPRGVDIEFAIMWTSLSDPNGVLDVFNQRHLAVTFATAAVTRFGKYTIDPKLNPYLLRLREEGGVVFDGTDDTQTQTHIILGSLLTRDTQ